MSSTIAVRRRKLIAKSDEQIQLAANKDYTHLRNINGLLTNMVTNVKLNLLNNKNKKIDTIKWGIRKSSID